MSPRPSVSVLTICRNDLPGLRATAESVASQTRAPDEWIVLDGASDDGTVDFLRSRGALAAWKSEPDAGIADAFNKVAAMAGGEWLLFLNSGDAFADERVLSDLALALGAAPPEVGVVFGDAIEIDPTGCSAPRISHGSAELGRGTNPICHQAAFLRRELQARHPYDSRLRIGMDYDLWHRLARVTGFQHVDRAVCLYRLGGMSSSRAWGEHAIVAHAMVDWMNLRGRRLGSGDAAALLAALAAYRSKKFLERLVGENQYLRLKSLLARRRRSA